MALFNSNIEARPQVEPTLFQMGLKPSPNPTQPLDIYNQNPNPNASPFYNPRFNQPIDPRLSKLTPQQQLAYTGRPQQAPQQIQGINKQSSQNIPELDYSKINNPSSVASGGGQQTTSSVPELDYTKAHPEAQNIGQQSGLNTFISGLGEFGKDTILAPYYGLKATYNAATAIPKTIVAAGQELYNNPSGALGAGTQAFETAVEKYGQTAVEKLVSKGLTLAGINAMSPEDIQKEFEQDTAKTAQLAKQYPGSTAIGTAVGAVGATSPIFAVSPNAGILANAGVMAGLGAIQTNQGQGANIFNPQNAAIQGAMGAAVGAVGNYANRTEALQQAQNIASNKYGYNGPILGQQVQPFLQNEGINNYPSDAFSSTTNWFNNKAANDVVTKTFQNEQNPALTQALAAKINQFTGGSTIPQTVDKLQQGIQATYQGAQKQESSLWNNFYSMIPNAPKNATPEQLQTLAAGAGPQAVQAYHEAASFTAAQNKLLDPTNHSFIANAIQEAQGDNQAAHTFLNYATSSAISSSEFANAAKAAGPEGTNVMIGKMYSDALSNSMIQIGDKSMVDVSKLFNNMKQVNNSVQGAYAGTAQEATAGLMKLYQLGQAAEIAPKTAGLMQKMAQYGMAAGGAFAIYHNPVIGLSAATLGVTSPQVLGLIARYQPLKTGLITLNRIGNNTPLFNIVAQNWMTKLLKYSAQASKLTTIEDNSESSQPNNQ